MNKQNKQIEELVKNNDTNNKDNKDNSKDNFDPSLIASKTLVADSKPLAVDNGFEEKKPSGSELFRCINCEKTTNYRTKLSEQKEDR